MRTIAVTTPYVDWTEHNERWVALVRKCLSTDFTNGEPMCIALHTPSMAIKLGLELIGAYSISENRWKTTNRSDSVTSFAYHV
jgi:hypothetical protein